TDSEARYTGFGVRVIKATARFRDPRYLEAGEALIRARRFVIATGSAPVVPAIPGLAEAPYLTNETIFDLAECPRHLLVLGGGPAGLELAQAHRRLGAAVGVFELAGLLNREDPELVEPLRRQLRREGVALHEGRAVTRVSQAAGGVQLHIAGDAPAVHAGSHLLVAAGRSPNVADLNLAAAGVRSNATGIVVDAGLRSSNPRVLAVGDVAGQGQFTHAAAHHAEIVLRRALFRLPARVRKDAIPRVVYTDPEIAVVGLSEAEARARHRAVSVLRWPFAENDRARAEGDTGGFIKVLTSARGRILGAGIVGPHAGELIQPWALALAERLMIGRMARLIVPYPTLSEVSKRAAASFFAPRLFRPRTRQLVRLLARLG
ncbi:MAG: dihydrolipoamide dehydrogenase, partial [Alphaproteobacteria bacterium]|nr:dihydrolipoamide dehydrogenase [Alphaproteobacteria bacterium]